MTEREALIANILEHPDVDLYRLVYADWLQCDAEPSEPERAELIRLQIELHQLTPTKPCSSFAAGCVCDSADCKVCALQRRSEELLNRFDKEWFPLLETTGFERIILKKGFVSEVHAPMEWIRGQPCAHCGGNGLDAIRTSADYPCDNCNGTRRIGGNLGELIKTQPIEFVGVTDREPMVFGNGFLWWNVVNYPVDNFHPRAIIPVEVFQFLRGILMTNGSFFYESKEDAQKDLSEAMLPLARS